MLEDDDCYQPDFSMPALEKNRIFKSFEIERAVAFVEIQNFRPTNVVDADCKGISLIYSCNKRLNRTK